MAGGNCFLKKEEIIMMNELWMKILVVVIFALCGLFYGLSHRATEERCGLKMPLVVIIAAVAGCAGWFLLGLNGMMWQAIIAIDVLIVNIFDKKFSQLSFATVALFFIKLLFYISAGRFGRVEAAWWTIGAILAFIIALMTLYKATITELDHAHTEEQCHNHNV